MSSVESANQRPRSAGAKTRQVAALVLKQVLSGRSLTDVLPRYSDKFSDPRDQGLVQELAFGVMRWYPRLDWLLCQLMRKPLKSKDRDIRALLFIGLYQLLFLRIADHAALHATAEAANRLGKRWAVGLVNGVLREFQRRRDDLLKAVQADAEADSAIPAWLLERIRNQWPADWQEVVDAFNARPPMSLRVNRRVIGRDDYLARLQKEGIAAVPMSITRSGITLEKPIDVASVPGFSEGLVSVQDGGAQLAAELLDLQPGQMILDACAAPGGKTGNILESEVDLQVTAVDVDEDRLQQVRDNLERLQLAAEVVQGDAANPNGVWSDRAYDRILLDVPCSATGVIRRHPDIKFLRRPDDIAPLVETQARILKSIWPLLHPEGLMLYATCSILPEENELQVAAFLQQEPSARAIHMEAAWGEPRSVGRQIAPGMQNMDGFYYALLHKVHA